MKLKNWWKRRSGWAKTVTILATVLTIQIGLCFSTPIPVLPVYAAVFGLGSDSELGLGLMFGQAMLCIVTVILLALAVVVAGAGGHFSSKENIDD